jgi:hypothetical protein
VSNFYVAGNGWVGWKKAEGGKDWLEIVFEFEQVRRFSGVELFSNNFPSKGVQVRESLVATYSTVYYLLLLSLLLFSA